MDRSLPNTPGDSHRGWVPQLRIPLPAEKRHRGKTTTDSKSRCLAAAVGNACAEASGHVVAFQNAFKRRGGGEFQIPNSKSQASNKLQTPSSKNQWESFNR